MLTYLISDLHLDASRPELKEILLRFLAHGARGASALYILGDLFEVWIGDDAADVEAKEVADALHSLAESGTAIFFLCGNRDFLLGGDYAASCGMRRLPDPCVADLGGCPTLLTHGDALCTSDTEYQSFRRQVREAKWQDAFLAQPAAARRAYAAQARAASAKHQRSANSVITDVDESAVEAQLAYFGVERMIHGHTHRPAEHIHSVGERVCERVVLADWREFGEALAISAQGIKRIQLS